MAALRGLRAALVFLTRIPVGGFPYAAEEWRWAPAWFPSVGALLGLLYAAIHLAVAPRAGDWIAAVLVVGASLLLTGAFHEDGLADTADALGGAYTRERLFEILKDSRIGTFGAAALVVFTLLRVVLLVRLGAAAAPALVFVECASRLPPVWLMSALPYVTDDARARSRQVARPLPLQTGLATASVLLLIALAVGGGWLTVGGAVAAGVALGLTSIYCGWLFVVRAGGITGDFLGATQQIGSAAIYLALVLAA